MKNSFLVAIAAWITGIPHLFAISDVLDCKMQRQNYNGGPSAISSDITFQSENIASSIECAALVLQHSSTDLAFLYDKLRAICTGMSSVLEPNPENSPNNVYHILSCRAKENIGEYIGCILDDGLDTPLNALSGPLTVFIDNTPEKCTEFCFSKGYVYAGVHATECSCENTYGTNAILSESSCDSPCPGNTAEMCGGYSCGAFSCRSVYSTGNG